MKTFNIIRQVILAAILCVLSACNETIPSFIKAIDPPVLSSFYPAEGYVSDEISIKGENLQTIDSVWIGGGLAKIKYKLSNEEMIVSVSNECKTGAVKIKGKGGETQSTGNFTYLFATPDIQTYPVEGEIGYEVEITGNFIDYVSKVLIGVNGKEAAIAYQSRRDMRVVVPVETNLTEVPLVFIYIDETGEKEIVSADNFKIIAKIPILLNTDNLKAVTTGRTRTFEGFNMRNIQKIFLETEGETRIYARVFSATGAAVSFSFEPRQLTALGLSEITAKLKYQYYETVEETASESFTLSQINPDNACYFWEDVVLTYRYISRYPSFFSCDSGSLFYGVDLVQQNSTGSFVNPLGLANQKAVDMMFYVNGSSVASLYGPHATGNVFRNYRYVDPTGTDSKASEYTFTNLTLGVSYDNIKNDTVRYKIFAETSVNQTTLKEMVLAGQITEDTVIDDEFFGDIAAPTANQAGNSTTQLKVNDVVWVKRAVDGRNGLMWVKKFSEAPLNNDSYITFDIYWQK